VLPKRKTQERSMKLKMKVRQKYRKVTLQSHTLNKATGTSSRLCPVKGEPLFQHTQGNNTPWVRTCRHSKGLHVWKLQAIEHTLCMFVPQGFMCWRLGPQCGSVEVGRTFKKLGLMLGAGGSHLWSQLLRRQRSEGSWFKASLGK
jgi:hypothetical protein